MRAQVELRGRPRVPGPGYRRWVGVGEALPMRTLPLESGGEQRVRRRSRSFLRLLLDRLVFRNQVRARVLS